MKSKLTLTDKLMVSLLGVSVMTALLHGTIPAVVSACVHVAVTVCVSVIHIRSLKSHDVPVAQIEEKN